MTLEELKSEVRNLSPEDRRKLALYVLELEKDHLHAAIGPQIAEDIDGVSKAIQDALERVKNAFKGT